MKSQAYKEKQPAVITVFFATEMWERFGFYMIQGLLVLYMTSQVFGLSDAYSYSILSAFTALSYITPIIGGYVASRILDFEHAITLGGFLLAIGYAILSLPYRELFFFVFIFTPPRPPHFMFFFFFFFFVYNKKKKNFLFFLQTPWGWLSG